MINSEKMEVTCHRCGAKIPLIRSALIATDKNALEVAYGICTNCGIVIEMTESDGLEGWDKKKTYSGADSFKIMAKLIEQLTGE